MALTNLEIQKAKAAKKPYKLADGGGLFLLVKANGSKLWQQKYRYLGKERLLSHGPYPEVSLAANRAFTSRCFPRPTRSTAVFMLS